MKERKLSHEEIFELTAAKIGHCSNIKQLEYIVYYTYQRIEALKTRRNRRRKALDKKRKAK